MVGALISFGFTAVIAAALYPFDVIPLQLCNCHLCFAETYQRFKKRGAQRGGLCAEVDSTLQMAWGSGEAYPEGSGRAPATNDFGTI